MPSEKREQEIKKEAREILDKFAKALSEVKEAPETYVERDEDRREEKDGKKSDSDFVKRFFDNAPQTKNKCIQAERGSWK